MLVSKPKVVAIGGGNGASQVLLGMRKHTPNVTGIIAVTDSGRSTGKIRIATGIPAPGDIRNALVNLSRADKFLQDLFQFRFRSPKLNDLDGMAFGNLFVAALSQMLGSFEKAVDKTGEFLAIQGKVIPIMLKSTHIACRRSDGSVDTEEVNVRAVGKSPIKRLFLKDGARAHPAAVQAIEQADLVTIGPGSLFTTIVACLLTPGIPRALSRARGKVVLLANTTAQPGQTEGYSIADHVKRVVEYLPPNTLDIVLVNRRRPNPAQASRLARQAIKYIPFSLKEKEEIERMGIRVVEADLVERHAPGRRLWNKQDTVRHDPYKTSTALLKLL